MDTAGGVLVDYIVVPLCHMRDAEHAERACEPCIGSRPTRSPLISNYCGWPLRTSGGDTTISNVSLKRASATITVVLIGSEPCAQPALQPAIPTWAGHDLHRRRGYTWEDKVLYSIWSTPSMMIGARYTAAQAMMPLLWEQNPESVRPITSWRSSLITPGTDTQPEPPL